MSVRDEIQHILLDVAAGRRNLPGHEADAYHAALNAESAPAATPGADQPAAPQEPAPASPGVFGG